MGLFERIFGNRPKSELVRNGTDYKALTVYQPQFNAFNRSLYESELVRSAINARATHISKLKVEFYGHGSKELSERLKRPNAFQSWSQFLARTSTILDNMNAVIIVPVFDMFGRVTEIYPILPQRAKIIEVKGQPWCAFEFSNGKYAQCPVWQCCIMTKFQFKNDYFGESNDALTPTMKLIDIQHQGIMEAVKSSATYRFMASLNNFTKPEDLKKERKRFDDNNFADGEGGGILLFPNNYVNIKQIDSKPFVADAEQMEQIRKNVFEYFGVNEDILTNTAYGDKWTAFYEGAVEPFAIQFSEVLTTMFVLTGQLSGECGVMATANRLQYMSNAEKLNVSSQLADRGILNRDEVREIWNLPPLPDGEGKAYIIRGEYKNANDQVNEGESNDGDT